MKQAPIRAIRELGDLSFLEYLSNEYVRQYGSPPFNLSHWDPCQDTTDFLLSTVELPQLNHIAPYIFSYDLDLQPAVVRKLGINDRGRTCFFVCNGTSAIFFGLWWLKAIGITHIIVVCPCYFSVLHGCQALGIHYSLVHAERRDRQWRLPIERLRRRVATRNRHAALWLTNPLYSTGVYWGLPESEQVNSLLDNGSIVVVDECNVPTGFEMTGQLQSSKGLLSLHSPHKSLCVNSVKFAALVYDDCYETFFTQWSDVIVGGLTLSNYAAILHFLGDNFDMVQRGFLQRVEQARNRVACLVELNRRCNLDLSAKGYLMSVYAPYLPDRGPGPTFMHDLVFKSGSIVIPGYRNHFDPRLGFTFRLNLARDCTQFLASTRRVLEYLAEAK